jgi:hypothetical protein
MKTTLPPAALLSLTASLAARRAAPAPLTWPRSLRIAVAVLAGLTVLCVFVLLWGPEPQP